MYQFAFVADLGVLSYFVLFALLAVSGLGISFGEELMLLLIGYLSYQGVLLLPLAVVVAYLGVLAADSLGFHFGRRLLRSFPRLLRWRPSLMRKSSGIRQRLKDARYVFVSRFIPSARMVVPIAAGFYGISWRKFFRCNVFAAALFAPALVALGLYAGPQISRIMAFFAAFSEVMFLALAIFAVFIVVRVVRSRAADAQ